MVSTYSGWYCDVKYDGCKGDAVTSWVCNVEGVQISACAPCKAQWRQRAAQNEDLQIRCPRCAHLAAPAVLRPVPKRPVRTAEPLTGIIADALENAMFREGIAQDLRKKVLVRLAQEEPWLQSPASESAVAG